ncbi:unnamed protein product [Dibothriocephalus latus]|uniref:G-protein coupled receptors family 1 profile domain-containing protein n=1 Tax=Dibothriocephalus latus TaxID=60516 RepID=A0A3P7P2C4_DIBLA|nr:unnamed protein product [Dibothriocephalus latus]
MDTGRCVLFPTLGCPDDLTPTETAVLRFRAYVIPVLLCIGIPSNLFVLAIFIRLQMKAACRFNIYAMGIAIAHLFQCVFQALLDHFIGRGLWYASGCQLTFKLDILSEVSCKIVAYTPAATQLLSAMLLVSFTIDRTVTVYRPIQSRGDIYLGYAYLGVLICFLFSFLSFIPAALYYVIVEKDDGTCRCQLLDPTAAGARYVILMSAFCSYTVPTFVILILNVLICYKLKYIVQGKRLEAKTTARQKIERRRILGHLGVCSLFLFLSMPLVIVMAIRQYSDAMQYADGCPEYHQEIVQLTKFFNSFIAIQYTSEIWVYLIFLPNVRSEAVRLLCGCKCLMKFEVVRRFFERYVRITSSQRRQKLANMSEKVGKKVKGEREGEGDSAGTTATDR